MRCDAGGGRSDVGAREAIRNTDYTDRRQCGVIVYVMEIGLAWCGGSSARGFKVRVLRWRSGVGAEGAARRSRSTRSTRSTRRGSLTLALGLVQAARGLWLPSACPGRSADLCRAATCLVGRWGCCRWARTLRCALRIASILLGFLAALVLGVVLHSTPP